VAQLTAERITFRCPPELAGVLPRPIPASHGLPDWFKALPPKVFCEHLNGDLLTIKKCPPVIDAMTYGFLMPLATDIKVENGEFAWDTGWPGGEFAKITRSPLGYHDPHQVAGTPFYDQDQFIIKFNNFWTIELPPGYSVLVMHPINRDELPFRTLCGLVDCDSYHDAFVQFPTRWVDPDFNGVLPKGTPMAQCIPIRRESWELRFEDIGEAEKQKVYGTSASVSNSTGVYREQFRSPKR